MKATRRIESTVRPMDGTSGCRLDGEFILWLAAERGWKNADEIAAGLGISRAAYFRLRNGGSCPRLDTARAVAMNASQPGKTVTVDQLFPVGQAA